MTKTTPLKFEHHEFPCERATRTWQGWKQRFMTGETIMTDKRLTLSDLKPGDVGVFVREDGSESEPFVVLEREFGGGIVTIEYIDSRWARAGGLNVRYLGRGRIEPARIVMEGES
jgi:hypothetical protein